MKQIGFVIFILLVFFLFPVISFSGTWSSMSSGTVRDLFGVWGSSGSDVFAVGKEGFILHYNGSDWLVQYSSPSPPSVVLRGVWGSSSSDVFAVGDDGLILHYDGSVWSAMNSGTTNNLYAVWGSSGSDIFAVGDIGTILHYDGSDWLVMDSGITWRLYGVWGSSPTDVFAVGGGLNINSSTILHYNGSNWSDMPYPLSTSPNINTLYDVWGSSSSYVLAIGTLYGWPGNVLLYNGSSWGRHLYSGRLYHGIWGSSRYDIFVVGRYGIWHDNGSDWETMTGTIPGGIYRDVWGASATDVFAVGEDGIISHYGENVTTTTIRPTTTTTIQATTTTTSILVTTTTTTTIQITTSTTSAVSTTTTTQRAGICAAEAVLSDDPESLNLLRHFRDDVLAKSANGKAMIKLYYEKSPQFVELIDNSPELKEQCRTTLKVVLPSIRKVVDKKPALRN